MRNIIWALVGVLVFSAGTLYAQIREEPRPGPRPPMQFVQDLPATRGDIANLAKEMATLAKQVQQLQATANDQTGRIYDMQKRLAATCYLVVQLERAGPSRAGFDSASCTAAGWAANMRAVFVIPFGG